MGLFYAEGDSRHTRPLGLELGYNAVQLGHLREKQRRLALTFRIGEAAASATSKLQTWAGEKVQALKEKHPEAIQSIGRLLSPQVAEIRHITTAPSLSEANGEELYRYVYGADQMPVELSTVKEAGADPSVIQTEIRL